MSDPALNKMDNSVLSQCLDFTKQLINTRTSFKFDLKLPSGFSFSFTTTDQKPSISRKGDIKKKSPSTLRRNAKRKQKFLEQKKNQSSTNELSKESFECDQCEYQANCKVSMRKHIAKEHILIPQLDGVLEESAVRISDNKESQTEIVTKDTEVQTVESQAEVCQENKIPIKSLKKKMCSKHEKLAIELDDLCCGLKPPQAQLDNCRDCNL